MPASMRLLPLFLLFAFSSLSAQNCTDCRYLSTVFDSIEVETVKFGEGMNAEGDNQELFMDLYTPYGDTASNRPVLIFAFGGGFVQGSRDEDYVKLVCRRFASTGYVAAAIDYRIGFDLIGGIFAPNQELMRTFFRPMQDMRASIQWFRAHADIMGNTLRINPDAIVSGGASAGGITACMVAYCDQASEFGEIGDTAAIDDLGGFYSSSGLYPSYSWESAGIFNIAGAVVNTKWMEAGDAPIFSAHGDQDITVPYEGGNFGIGPISVGLEGSGSIHQAAQQIGLCSQLFTMEGEDHPSGNESDVYYENIFLRALPLALGMADGLDFCCSHSVSIVEDSSVANAPTEPIGLRADVSNAPNATVQWCESICSAPRYGNTYSTSKDAEDNRYFMAVAVENGCIAGNHFILGPEDPVGRFEAQAIDHIKIFPNPTQDHLFLDFSAHNQAKVQVQLIAADGRILRETEISGLGVQQISLEGVPAGLYFLRLDGMGQITIQKQ